MTVGLIAANLIVFWYELSLGRQLGSFVERWGLVPTAVRVVFGGDLSQVGALITPLSAMFLHAGWLHLVRNLVYLWFFGRSIEPQLGPVPLLTLYILAGLAAALAQVVATPTSGVPAIGASGAVAGLLGAYLPLRLGRGRGGPGPAVRGTDLLAACLLVLWLATLALGGVLEIAQLAPSSSQFSWWGHLVGLLVGVFLVFLYRHLRHPSLGGLP